MDQQFVDTAVTVKNTVHEMLSSKPNVVGTDVGFKYIGGKRTDQIAIRVFVSKKENAAADAAIPSTIEGIPTDVIVRGKVVLQVPTGATVQDDTNRHDTFAGGMSIGPCRYALAGTVGAIVQKADDDYYALSNFHVMCVDTGWKVGDRIAQPAVYDGGDCATDVIGTLDSACLATKFGPSTSVDAAICTVTHRAVANNINGLGALTGTAPAVLGSRVRKVGRTTDLTFGTIDGVAGGTPPISYGFDLGFITLTNQITIAPDTTINSRFSDHGDSGSVIVNDHNQVVGLLFAGTDDGTATFANPFSDVEQALGVSLFTVLPHGLYLFEYKQDEGTVAIDHVKNNLYGTTEMWRDHWTSGWTSVETFKLNGFAFVFEYKSEGGEVGIDEFNANAQGTREVWRGSWTEDWTTIKPFHHGNDVCLIEYKIGDGTVAIDRINANAQGTTELWRGSWTQGWTSIEPFSMGGNSYLFEYKSGDGTVAIDQVNADLHGTTEKWRGSWTQGWTTIKPFSMGGNTYLFLYKAEAGTVVIDQINANLQGTTERWRSGWTLGWTSIECFRLGNSVYLFEYKIGDGTVAIDQINANVQGTTEKWRSRWTTGWTSIKPAFSD